VVALRRCPSAAVRQGEALAGPGALVAPGVFVFAFAIRVEPADLVVPGRLGLGVGRRWGVGHLAFEHGHGAFERLTGDLYPDSGQSF